MIDWLRFLQRAVVLGRWHTPYARAIYRSLHTGNWANIRSFGSGQ